MVEDRRRKRKGRQAHERAARHVDVAFAREDVRAHAAAHDVEDEVAETARNHDRKTHEKGLPEAEGRNPEERRRGEKAAEDAHERPHEGAVRVEGEGLLSDEGARDRRAEVGDEEDREEEEHHERSRRVVARQVERCDGRGVAHAEDTEHDPPLHLGDALEIAVRVLRERHDDGQRQEEIDRNEEREERRQVKPDEDVLQRDRDVEGRDERVVVGRLRRRDATPSSGSNETPCFTLKVI